MNTVYLGIDLVKNVFHLYGLNQAVKPLYTKRVKRKILLQTIGKGGIHTTILFDINQGTYCGAGTAQTDRYVLADRGQCCHNAPVEGGLVRIRLEDSHPSSSAQCRHAPCPTFPPGPVSRRTRASPERKSASGFGHRPFSIRRTMV